MTMKPHEGRAGYSVHVHCVYSTVYCVYYSTCTYVHVYRAVHCAYHMYMYTHVHTVQYSVYTTCTCTCIHIYIQYSTVCIPHLPAIHVHIQYSRVCIPQVHVHVYKSTMPKSHSLSHNQGSYCMYMHITLYNTHKNDYNTDCTKYKLCIIHVPSHFLSLQLGACDPPEGWWMTEYTVLSRMHVQYMYMYY